MEQSKTSPSFAYSLGTLAIVVAFMLISMVGFGASLQIVFFLSWLIVIPACMKLGYSYKEIEEAASEMIKKCLQPTMILLAVGAMIGVWISSGTVPTIIYGGLVVITPTFFLLTALILCSLTSLATGTSWGTIGTAGLALMGVGAGLEVPAGITAGAVISGAYFGDKMSPLSDSTNLAAAVSGGALIPHVKAMFFTVGPAYLLSAILYTVIGFRHVSGTVDQVQLESILSALRGEFHIGIIALIPAVIVLTLLVMQKPAFTSILIGAVAGAVVAVINQGFSYSEVLQHMYTGFRIESGTEFIDSLLNRGGVMSMVGPVLIMIFAFGFAGMMHHVGMMDALLRPLTNKVKSDRSLIGSTMIVSYVTNAIGSSMTFSAVMTGTLMAPLYKEHKLKPENLSRVIEACGTLGGVLIPWNSNAIFVSGMLGVTPIQYIPYAFLNWLTPMVTLFYAVTGIAMIKEEPDTNTVQKVS